MREDSSSKLKVGALVLVALAVIAIGTILIGEQSHLFSRKNTYYASFNSVSGLNPGNPVQLNGVDVGTVRQIVLPEDPSESQIRVAISVDRRYAGRVRKDSDARIKTLGLLGDKFVQLTSGSPDAALIEDGGDIPTAAPTSVDELMSTGEDVMANVTEISSSLKVILKRMEEGQGLFGELTTDAKSGEKVVDAAIEALGATKSLMQTLETGDGTLPRLINDPTVAQNLTVALDRLNSTLAKIENGEGLLPMLLNDPEGPRKLDATLASIQSSAADLSHFTAQVEEGEGLLPKLITDAEYSARVTSELEQILSKLNQIADKLNGGDGTVAKLIEDPEVYTALNDILVGVNESKFLRWLIRNRQKKGIEVRYEDALEEAPPGTPDAKELEKSEGGDGTTTGTATGDGR
jgi:phospholipid/cholesterol/gamma-HCH transport system substrate-binding protein